MEIIQVLKEKTEKLVAMLIDDFEIDVIDEGEDRYVVLIKTENDAPVIIGHHSETIQSIQKILDVAMYKALGKKVNFVVNVNDYQEKRKERLQHLVDQAIERVKESGTSANLRGFSAFERRMIHEYLVDNHSDFESYSVGEGRDRRLVIKQRE